MPESLLDTYTAERRPVAEAVLANTLAQTAIMRPDPQSGAMRDIVANLMQFDDVNRLIGEMMSGLSIRYDLGSERDDVGRLIGDRPISHGDAEGLALRCHAGWHGRSSRRLNRGEGFQARCGQHAEDTLRRRRYRAFDADPSRCLHCLGR